MQRRRFCSSWQLDGSSMHSGPMPHARRDSRAAFRKQGLWTFLSGLWNPAKFFNSTHRPSIGPRLRSRVRKASRLDRVRKASRQIVRTARTRLTHSPLTQRMGRGPCQGGRPTPARQHDGHVRQFGLSEHSGASTPSRSREPLPLADEGLLWHVVLLRMLGGAFSGFATTEQVGVGWLHADETVSS